MGRRLTPPPAIASLRSAGNPQGGPFPPRASHQWGGSVRIARRFGDCPGPAEPATIAAERSEAIGLPRIARCPLHFVANRADGNDTNKRVPTIRCR